MEPYQDSGIMENNEGAEGYHESRFVPQRLLRRREMWYGSRGVPTRGCRMGLRSFVTNCHIWPRQGDGPLFTGHDGGTPTERVEASLDGYLVMPLEMAREMLKDPSILDVPEAA